MILKIAIPGMFRMKFLKKNGMTSLMDQDADIIQMRLQIDF